MVLLFWWAARFYQHFTSGHLEFDVEEMTIFPAREDDLIWMLIAFRWRYFIGYEIGIYYINIYYYTLYFDA